ncbi:hypothetical protein AAV35_004000 [Salimicrobium jeotgali]|uniref:Uncharacterized protein n=2 Tax=Salimicrobium jeotgali TaxID=1230341 RepID=K2HBX0_9BACI|nr:hypothetical protein AAV35_004000 [Salimicrobium jeotgali]EKE33080.1 hypothetical protein MJ3_01230 [Salimicrobium jeotgali]
MKVTIMEETLPSVPLSKREGKEKSELPHDDRILLLFLLKKETTLATEENSGSNTLIFVKSI